MFLQPAVTVPTSRDLQLPLGDLQLPPGDLCISSVTFSPPLRANLWQRDIGKCGKEGKIFHGSLETNTFKNFKWNSK